VGGYHIRPEDREQRITLGPLLPDDDVHAAFALTTRECDRIRRLRARCTGESRRSTVL
jgi:hypothetical protein